MYVLPARMPRKQLGSGGKRKAPEQTLQRQVATFLEWALPPDAWFTSIGHGGGGAVRGAILKSTGMKSGVPDILIIYRSKSIWVELKSATGSLSEAQRSVHSAITVAGGVVTTCRSVDDVSGFLQALQIPLRARLMPAERAVERRKLLERSSEHGDADILIDRSSGFGRRVLADRGLCASGDTDPGAIQSGAPRDSGADRDPMARE